MAEKTKVLYIEDDLGSQQLIRRVLESHGYEVLIAGEGLQGVTLARENLPHLILMDMHLPGLNGREITTRLRSIPYFAETPIVALTANTSPGSREQALAAGCDGFMTKPINVVSFPKELELFLKGHREQLEESQKLQQLQLHAQRMVARLEDKITELQTTNNRLRELDRIKSNFIALVSHELRTPLTLLEGYTHLLVDHVKENDPQMASPALMGLVEGLHMGVKRIGQVISEIINVSRIASGTLELAVGPVVIGQLVRAVADDVRSNCERRRITLQVEDLSHLPIIEGDGVELRVAISNVVGNAIKYTPDGGQIWVRGQVVSNAVDLIVQDTGIGIPEEEQRRIFDDFHVLGAIERHSTSKSAFKGGGMGLGLAITRGIVEAHNGHIWVESHQQGSSSDQMPGSTFHLLLPISQSRL